ncbi:Gamma-D-glutamyl-L-diamino acid endopeptidase 1 [Bacillus altitudinis]|uniref:M14 family metallopeptidase n=1 Tax=Bacillus altitudinis TaxID=293387 RepID=UPI00201905C7|nr:M14 family metallocarboxypeptidase [Bacillus altitudinis]MCL4099818.1 Gamma-D-glutamyl-L-diamino acid endopeptidase 1 [Bacillus altitudinis]
MKKSFGTIEWHLDEARKEDVAKQLGIGKEAFRLSNQSNTDHLLLPGYRLPEGTHSFQSVGDVQSFIAPYRLQQSDEWISGTFEYDSAHLEGELQYLKAVFPFLQMSVIGQSVLNTPIYEIRTEPVQHLHSIHVNASFHANEWITTSVLLKWLKSLCLAASDPVQARHHEAVRILQTTALSIVPMVNPDGVDLVRNGPESLGLCGEEFAPLNGGFSDYREWKANIRGIDLNNQFPAYWEIEYYRNKPKAPSYRDFPGHQPLTEPEAKAMAHLALRKRFDRLIALHTQGEEIYWGFLGHEPAISKETVERLERVSGYKAIQYLDSYAGYRDWFIYQCKSEGYTVELGQGKNPLSMSQFDSIYEKTKRLLWEACKY